jgi:hypothetical protein
MAPAPKVWERKLYQSLSEWNSGMFDYKKEGFGKFPGKYIRYTDRTKNHRVKADSMDILSATLSGKNCCPLSSLK